MNMPIFCIWRVYDISISKKLYEIGVVITVIKKVRKDMIKKIILKFHH